MFARCRFGCKRERGEMAQVFEERVSHNSVQGLHTVTVQPTGNHLHCDMSLFSQLMLMSRMTVFGRK